ncbi:MAG: HNH endonuclease [Bacteroidia bacterium]|nr:HNH endonuclease [Bacteroidia bacterium]
MSRPRISKKDREFVKEQANFTCEYCLLHQEDAFFTFHIDHIISLKHGGSNSRENFCLACLYCNLNKGSNVGTVLPPGDRFLPLYHPRKQRWSDHFSIEDILIKPLSEIGEATIKVLDFNHEDRLRERELLLKLGRYPSKESLVYLQNQVKTLIK